MSKQSEDNVKRIYSIEIPTRWMFIQSGSN